MILKAVTRIEPDQQLEVCPVDVQDCEWLDKLGRLKQENEELKLLVTTDPLTGLFNYRYFQEALGNEMQRTYRTGRPTCLVVIDLDHFKDVNDERGHEAGNMALKTAGKVFRQELRPFDIICRYGGEEFAIILPQTNLPIAVNIAERVRVSLEKTSVVFEDHVFNVTASFGVAIYEHGSQLFEKTFVEIADKFMYQAKQQGRNRVCHQDYASLAPPTAVSSEEKEALFQRKDNSSKDEE